jgi:kumamolisin
MPADAPRLRDLATALFATALLALGAAGPAWARGSGQVVIPDSSIEDPATIGKAAHTNLRFFVPTGGMDQVAPPQYVSGQGTKSEAPASGYYFLETPASLACVYNLVAPVAGCSPYQTLTNPSGGSRMIAIVDAYDNASAASDFAKFSSQFGLPTTGLAVVFASGKRPTTNSSWAVESALDIEWAHAMAPAATIVLVEAASNSLADLLHAVTVASDLVAAAGGGEVSMSWATSEFGGENAYDSYFTKEGVVYVASAGDSPGVMYPSASPNVISAGGTALSRNPATGNFQGELAWQQAGGGPSAYEPMPAYQHDVAGIVGQHRGTPDVAANADPTTGVWVYHGTGWYIVGGTSVAAPLWAGILNRAGHFAPSSADELRRIYRHPDDLHVIADGDCGPYEGYMAQAPWSFCTGAGSPDGLGGK